MHDEAAPKDGTVAFEASAGTEADAKRVGLEATFDELVTTSDGVFVQADVDGGVRVDGLPAATFDGVLNDGDGDGVPSDGLTLRFSNGETTTLEAFQASFRVPAPPFALPLPR